MCIILYDNFICIFSYAKKKERERSIYRHIVARDTKATSTVSESRGIAPFGQLAREQQAARASDRRPHRAPLALARHE